MPQRNNRSSENSIKGRASAPEKNENFRYKMFSAGMPSSKPDGIKNYNCSILSFYMLYGLQNISLLIIAVNASLKVEQILLT